MGRVCLAVCLAVASALLGTPAAAANLRVVTFNAGMGKVLSLRSSGTVRDTFVEDARLGGAHVLALQELCLNQRFSLREFLSVMRKGHGVQYHFADYAGRPDACGKGQAIVSAYPILDAGTLELPRVGARRVAIWVDLGVEGPNYERLRVYNVHFSNREGWDFAPLQGRLRQAREVIRHAVAFREKFETASVIVAGDFNSLGSLYDPAREEPAIKEFLERFRSATHEFAPTMLLPYKVDWIFYSGLRYRRSKVAHVFFSDHFPVVADFDF
jgi:endonuclease/exonuclease/phosphatase family metal-dependent hydrolase